MADHECACGGGGCGCGESHSHTQQVYLTREDYIARLEQYLVDLKAEIQAVEDELVTLREEAVAAD